MDSIRHMSADVRGLRAVKSRDAFGAYGAAAKGAPAHDLGVYSPCIQLATTFAYQSYLSSSLYQLAINLQRPNEPIVAGTLLSEDIVGYGIGLHPSSETPVAIQFKGATTSGTGASATIVLKPGEIVRPADGAFSGFSWGMPYGWLGGGEANLIIFVTPEAWVDWSNDLREVIFHRVRLPILAPASVPTVANSRLNWPIRFPWTNAFGGSTNVPQQGKPVVTVNPSKILLIVRKSSTTTNPPTIRFLINAVDDFAIGSDGTTLDTTFNTYQDVVVPTQAAPAGLTNQLTNYPVIEINSGPLMRGGDFCRVTLVDMDDGDDIAGVEVDIHRYGRL